MSDALSPAMSELDELVDHLEGVRARAANAFAAETYFFANVARLVERRERERAARADEGSTVHGTQLGMREVYAEIAAALRLSEYQVAARVSAASVMSDHFRETLCDVSDGRISPQHAQVIADTGIQIQDAVVRAEYERHARDIAPELTAAQLRNALDGLVSRLDPDGTRERVRQAVAERGVRLRHVKAGLSRLSIDLPTAEAVGAVNRLNDMADEILAENQAIAAAAAVASKHPYGPDPIDAQNPAATGQPRAAAPGEPCEVAPDQPRAATPGEPGPGPDPAPGPGPRPGSAPTTTATARIDERTKRQIAADIAADLLLTSAPDGHGVSEHTRSILATIRPTVHVTIPAGVIASAALDAVQLAGGTFGAPTRVPLGGRPVADAGAQSCSSAAMPHAESPAGAADTVTSIDILHSVVSAAVGLAEIPGHGPVDDATARELAKLADGWVRVFTDPDTGVPVDVDRYRPTTRQRLYLEARDQHCRFPGCRRPAEKCDVDHTTAHVEGGPTALCNLACLCKRHHTVKHHTDWRVIQLSGGVMKWTSPTRRIHRTRPSGTVRFVAAPHPPDQRDEPAPF